MIAYLKGELLAVESETAVIEAQGVGYEIYGTALTLAHLSSRIGQSVAVWIYTHVREDALQLFGFPLKSEKELFLSLLKVNGVGPKMALSILSGGTAADIQDMIESGNAKALSSLPRVGKKTAEQIILTLQGKLVRAEKPAAGASKTALLENHKQVHTALVNLGFKLQKVDEFVADLPKDIEVEAGVRRGLAQLTSAR